MCGITIVHGYIGTPICRRHIGQVAERSAYSIFRIPQLNDYIKFTQEELSEDKLGFVCLFVFCFWVFFFVVDCLGHCAIIHWIRLCTAKTPTPTSVV